MVFRDQGGWLQVPGGGGGGGGWEREGEGGRGGEGEGGGLLKSYSPMISNLSNHLRPINAMLFKRLVKNSMQCLERIRLKLNLKGQHTDYVIQLCFLFFSISLCGQPVALCFFSRCPFAL